MNNSFLKFRVVDKIKFQKGITRQLGVFFILRKFWSIFTNFNLEIGWITKQLLKNSNFKSGWIIVQFWISCFDRGVIRLYFWFFIRPLFSGGPKWLVLRPQFLYINEITGKVWFVDFRMITSKISCSLIQPVVF